MRIPDAAPSVGRASGSHHRAPRVLALMQHLEAARRDLVATSDIARELGVSERQIRRDAEAFIDAGYDLDRGLIESCSAIRRRPTRTERVPLGFSGVKVTSALDDNEDGTRGEILNELVS